MITVSNITKSFGAETLFTDVSFSVGKKERVGLVGRNGHGKTTLMRMIAGFESPDSGSITMPKGYRIGYMGQHIEFRTDTVIDEACRDMPAHMRHETWYAEKILAGLGFTEDALKKDLKSLSGGFQVRLNLARIICSAPDMLLLDEPTNYLDIVSIRWLSSFLRQWKGEVLLVTHDRSFMDGVITHVLGICRRRVRKMEGTTEKYYGQIAMEEEILEKTRANEEKKRKETELFISRFRAKARLAGLVQSRIKALEKQQPSERLEKVKTLDFYFEYAPFPAKVLLHAEDLSFGYDAQKPLFRGLGFVINRHDRICIIGRNGKGKTTLLRLLAGELSPRDGRITMHPAAKVGYFAQTNRMELNDSFTVEEEIMGAGCTRQRARDICGLMMFGGDLALKQVGVLSGGEKSRVLLGKILATPSNLLLLDEPTNHLDMESCEAFLSALDSFDGAVVIVTHNEMYLHALANRLVVFRDDGAFFFDGTYSDFLDRIGWEDGGLREPARKVQITGRDTRSKKEIRKHKAAMIAKMEARARPIKRRITEVERTIEEKEAELQQLDRDMIEASETGDGKKITAISKACHGLRIEVEALYDELEKLTDTVESLRAEMSGQERS